MSYAPADQPLGLTRHAAERAVERGIDPADIALIAAHGRRVERRDKGGPPSWTCRLHPADIRHLPELDRLLGVAVVVGLNGNIVTAFRDRPAPPPRLRLKRSKHEARKYANRNAGQPWRGA